jgi:outer membrane receptor for ferrienterochelin and colicin
LLISAALMTPATLSAGYWPQPARDQQLKQLSLARLEDVEVTTASKEPEELWQTPAAIAVIPQNDIRFFGTVNWT